MQTTAGKQTCMVSQGILVGDVCIFDPQAPITTTYQVDAVVGYTSGSC